MFENIEKGMIIKLYENADNKYIVVDIAIKNDEQYLLLNPIGDIENEEIILNVKDMVLIKLLNNENGFEFVKDMDLVKEIVIELLKQ